MHQTPKQCYGKTFTKKNVDLNFKLSQQLFLLNKNLQGDSGGPLITTEKDKIWTLVGLVSYGAAASCQVGYPDVFTRVSSYLSWITNTTGISIRA